MMRTARHLGYRIFRPTIETVVILLVFGLFGIVLNGLWMIDHQSSRTPRTVKWKDFVDRDVAVDLNSPRVRVRRQQVVQFMRERDQLLYEMEKLRQEESKEMDAELPETHSSPSREWGDLMIETPEVDFKRVASHQDRIEREDGNKARFDSDATFGKSQQSNNSHGKTNQNANKVNVIGVKPRRPRKRIHTKDSPRGHVTLTTNSYNTSIQERNISSGLPEVAHRRWCTVYNTTSEVIGSEFEFDCIRLRIKPLTTICLYGDDDDIHVSRHLREDGLWEPHEVRLFQNLLFQNPDLDVIDIGAQLGEYTLLAAAMGRRVVALEPLTTSIRRLHKAIKIGHFEDKIVLVANPVSDARGEFIMDVPEGNQGGASLRFGSSIPCEDDFGDPISCPSNSTLTIVMDDLLEVVDFRRAVMKIDIEGHEHRAFGQADKLFDQVKIPYIFMEWIKLRAHYGAEVDDTDDKRRVQRLVDWLTDRGYVAYSLVLIQKLNAEYWYGWPDDVIWQHVDADPFF